MACCTCVLPSLEAAMTKNEVASLYNCNINIFQVTELYRCEITEEREIHIVYSTQNKPPDSFLTVTVCSYFFFCTTSMFDFKDQLQALGFS